MRDNIPPGHPTPATPLPKVPQEALAATIEERLREIQHAFQRTAAVAERSTFHADRAEQIAGAAREDIVKTTAALSKIEDAVFGLLALPAQVHSVAGSLVATQNAVTHVATRLTQLEQEIARANSVAGRSWRATSEMRGEVARMSELILDSLRRLEVEAHERARLERELQATKAAAENAHREAEEASQWAERTGRHHIDAAMARASKSEEILTEAARATIERKRIWTNTSARIALGVFGGGGLVAVILAALLQRDCGAPQHRPVPAPPAATTTATLPE